MQFNKELLTNTRGASGYENCGNPVTRELLLEKDAFSRMAKPLASSGPDIIHLRSKDIPTKSFFTKIELLATGSDNTIKNTIVQFSIFNVKNAKLSPFGYFIEYIPEGDFTLAGKSDVVTSFFDWYSTGEFLRIDEDDKISRNLDIVFDPRYRVFDKSSVFSDERFRFDFFNRRKKRLLVSDNPSARDVCSSVPRNKWLPPLMWRLRGVKYGKFKRTVS